jgi:hypothetical protein
LVIGGGTARVFVKDDDGSWAEQGAPGDFTIDVLGTNAVIYMLHAGRIQTPQGSRWFETYLVMATMPNDKQLLVRWVRMVNNVDTPEADPDHAGSSDGEGTLKRISAADGG